MSYNNFNNNGYMPNQYNTYSQYQSPYPTYQTQPYMQQNILRQQPTQQTTNSIPFTDIKFVNKKEAEGFSPFPNTSNLLIDRNNKMFYIKSANNLGESTTYTYKYEEINPDAEITKENEKPNIDLSMFIKKEDLQLFATKKDLSNFTTKDDLKGLKEKIDKLHKLVKSEILEGDENGK